MANVMWRRVGIFLEMIKFSHTVFALPFALLAACLALHRQGGWHGLDLVGVVVCMVFARSAAMGFNRWADRDLDARNPRTQNRAIPAGQLTAGQVLAFVLVCSAGFIAGTGIFWLTARNPWPLFLSVPVLAFLLSYSYAKRFTALAHVWLGTALALAPVAAWIAIRPQLEWPPFLLSLAIVGWVTGFDIIYACQDIEVDQQLGLHSIPARFGFAGALWVARWAHGAMLAALLAFGLVTPELHGWYWVGLAVVGMLLIIEHWLVRGRDLLRINLAFFQVNAVVSLGLFVVTLLDLFAYPGR